MKRLYITLTILFCINSTLLAEEDLLTWSHGIFSTLEAQHLSLDYLRDRGIEYIDVDKFSGEKVLDDKNYISSDIIRSLLLTINTMSTQKPYDITAHMNYSSTNTDMNTCIMSIIGCKYLYIREDALDKGLVRYENEHVYDVYENNIWQNPYNIGYAFAGAPSDTLFLNNVSFKFPEQTWLSNNNGNIQFDPGDGNGYRSVSKNSSFNVSYSAGVHELKIKYIIDNKTLICHSKIRTISNSHHFSRTDVEVIPDYDPISTYYEGQLVEGLIWSAGYGSVPFIVAEGFDIDFKKNKNSKGYGQLDISSFISHIEDYNAFLAEYKVYYLDLKDPTLPIEANSALLEEVIKSVNKEFGKTESILFGSSMGGLMARYALRNMELKGTKHNVGMLICHDTPNLGANVPLGAMFALHCVSQIHTAYLQRLSISRDKILGKLDFAHSIAAQQMMLNYVNLSGNIDHTEHNKFFSKLRTMGYPVGDKGTLKLLALSNGNSPLMGINDHIVNGNLELSLTEFFKVLETIYSVIPLIDPLVVGYITNDLGSILASFFPGSSSVKCSLTINPTGSQDPLCHVKLTYQKKLFGIKLAQKTFFEYKRSMPPGILSYDLARSSYYDLDEVDLRDEVQEFIKDSKLWLKICDNVEYMPHIPFVPTVSALDIGEGKITLTNEDLNKVYATGIKPSSPKHSPFHNFYVNGPSEKHITLNSSMQSWLSNHLKAYIDGDSIAFTGSKYRIQNIDNNAPVEWSIDSTNIATINSEGVITVKKHGIFTLTANFPNNKGDTISINRIFMAGFPDFLIRCIREASSYCVWLNEYEDTNRPDSLNFIFRNFLKAETAIGSSISTLKWKEIPRDSVQYFPVGSNGNFNVYFRLKFVDSNNNSHYTNPQYVNICTAYPYIIEPNYIKVSGTAILNSINLKKNPNYTKEFDEDMKIYYVLTEGSKPISGVHGITSLTLNAENLFTETQVYNAKFNYTGPISVTFQVRNNKGDLIQQFNVSMIK